MGTYQQESKAFRFKKKKPVVVTTSEGAVVNACLRWLLAHGIEAWRNNTGAHKSSYTRKDGTMGESWVRYGKQGSGDILAIIPPHGRHLEVECKTARNDLSPDQLYRKQVVESKGGMYIVARSIDDLEARKHELIA